MLNTVMKSRQRFVKNRGFRAEINEESFIKKFKALEIGFGTGRFIQEFLRRGIVVDGVEPDEDYIFELYKELRISGYFISPVNIGKKLALKLEKRFLNLLNNILEERVGREEELFLQVLDGGVLSADGNTPPDGHPSAPYQGGQTTPKAASEGNFIPPTKSTQGRADTRVRPYSNNRNYSNGDLWVNVSILNRTPCSTKKRWIPFNK
jgi:hypothetical protein